MGQAKRRGNFEQRVEQARERIEAEHDQHGKDVAEMANLEKRQHAGLQQWVDTHVIPQMDRQHGALARVDFTDIPMMVKAQEEEELKDRIEKLRKQYETLRSNT